MRWTALVLLVLLVTIITACGGDDKDGEKPVPDATRELEPAMPASVLVSLQENYESLRTSQQAISDIWEALAANEEVQCGNYPEALSPDAISVEGSAAYQPLGDLLREAAVDIDHAVTTWKAECTNPRQFPPADVIDEGRRAARSAGDALREAEALLADLQ